MKGSYTTIATEGESVDRYFVANHGDSFEQIEASGAKSMADERFVAAYQEARLKRVNRWLFKVAAS